MSISEKTLVVLGATSSVAHVYLRLVADEGSFSRFVPVARNAKKLQIVADDVAARSGDDVRSITADLGDPEGVEDAFARILDVAPSIDECLLAYGALGEQETLQSNVDQLRSLLDTNFVSAAIWMESIAKQFEAQGHGHLVVIGSVAGDRGRQSNYIYGSTKSGLERISEGMAHRFATRKDIHVTLVKPGFIDTPMTAHIEKSGPLWAQPEQVAAEIRKSVRKKRVRIYTPWFWRFILIIVRALPIPIFHKTKM